MDEGVVNQSNNFLPYGLTKVASIYSWHHVQVHQLIDVSTSLNKNIYLDELLLRRHHPNTIFENIFRMLDDNQYFAFKIITSENVKSRLEAQLPVRLLQLYYPFHFLVKRVIPKLKGFRKVCRVLRWPVDISKAEIIGRLIFKGLEIEYVDESAHETLIIVKKNQAHIPSETRPEPSEGVLFTMNRIGKAGKKIKVYKFRSMHPYAEYAQRFVYDQNGLDKSGKFQNDYRISTGGKIIRKYWIDELPMIFNLLKGDIKLIGVRPISEHYFELYPQELQQLRLKTKPGLLPPFYADLPKSFDEIVASELNYLRSYEDAPFRTDVSYFVKILKNIFVKKVRSK